MSRANLLRREYGIDRTISDPINIRDLAIIVQALKQGKKRPK